jgi:hydrogenase maturation factor HypF (carbamoyltransferase family)
MGHTASIKIGRLIDLFRESCNESECSSFSGNAGIGLEALSAGLQLGAL